MTTATSPDDTLPLFPDHQAAARAALSAGLAHAASGRRPEAIQHCHAALRLDPKLSPARDALRDLGELSRLVSEGDAANRRRQWPEAARAYAQALAIEPGFAAIWVQYGHALKEQGLLDAAETAYRTALGHMPQPDGDIHLQIGHLLKLRGMLPEARQAYLACLGVEPDNPHAKRELAAMLGRRVSRLPEIAPSSTAGGRPYTEVPLAASPGERIRISHQHGLACFTAEGPDPQLELAPDFLCASTLCTYCMSSSITVAWSMFVSGVTLAKALYMPHKFFWLHKSFVRNHINIGAVSRLCCNKEIKAF
jgi:tetratricopeptide (TPR) repeat protein